MPARSGRAPSSVAMTGTSVGSCSWARYAIRRPRGRVTRPPSGGSTPAIVRRSVDFPLPFGPMSPIRAWSSMAHEMFVKIARSPCARVTATRSVTITRPFDTHPDARWNGTRMAAIDTPFPVTRPRYTGILEWVTTVDHKKIGVLYLWTTFFFFITGGLLALAVRAQLATPDGKILD